MRIGPTKNSNGGTLEWSLYAERGAGWCIDVRDDGPGSIGEMELRITVNIFSWGFAPPLADDEIDIKDERENAGVGAALVAAGIANPTGYVSTRDYGTHKASWPRYRLTAAALEERGRWAAGFVR